MKTTKNIKFNKKKLIPIAEKYSLNYIALFGSRADGSAQADSDYDLIYSSKNDIDYGREAELTMELAAVFESNKIDLTNAGNASPLLLKEVYNNSVLLFEATKNSYDNFLAYSFMTYIEAKPLFKMKMDYLVKNIS